MINFAAIVPHPPLLIPNIGKEGSSKLKATKEGLEDLAKKLEKAELDTLFVISSHKKMHKNVLGILMADKYFASFKEFGDFDTKEEYSPDLELIEKIRHRALDSNISLNLIHSQELDYGFGVPLHFLNRKKLNIIPFVHSHLSTKEHYEIGRSIKSELTNSSKKIGIIASGNLSYKSTEKSIAGFSPKAREFNDKVIELLETKNTSGLLSLDEKLIKEAEDASLSSIALTLGIVEKMNYKPQTFSFEAPLGIGYLVSNLKFL